MPARKPIRMRSSRRRLGIPDCHYPTSAFFCLVGGEAPARYAWMTAQLLRPQRRKRGFTPAPDLLYLRRPAWPLPTTCHCEEYEPWPCRISA